MFFYTENSNGLCCDELLEILTEFSPKTLHEFQYSEEWNFSISGLQSFFENWRGRIPIEFNTRFDRSIFYTGNHVEVIQKYFDEEVISKETKHLLGVVRLE